MPSVDPMAVEAGEGKETFVLKEPERSELAQEICDTLTLYDDAMEGRIRRLQQINDSYNLVADSKRGGASAHSQRLVSELTRSQVNIATARIVEGIMGVEPLLMVQVFDDQKDDAVTQDLVEEGEASQEFLENYQAGVVKLPRKLQTAVHRACKLGGAVLRLTWKKNDHKYYYRDIDEQRQVVSVNRGAVCVDLIFSDQVVVWPLHEQDIEKLDFIGHRNYLIPSKFRRLAKRLELSAEDVKEVLEASIGTESLAHRTREKDLAGKDINVSQMGPKDGEVQVTELFLNDWIIGDRDPENLQVFLHEETKKILWIGVNPFRAQRPPYFLIPYWTEDGSFWPTGVGHECLWPQAADSALWNLFIDNLKLIGNYLRILRAGSMAESLSDQIAPGINVVTENPEEDMRFEALGGDLSQIVQAQSLNDLRAMKLTSITAPSMGMGDPVLKSGADPSSISQLIEQAGKRFGQVDRNMRESISEIAMFILELVQQYAPDGSIEEVVSEENAALIKRSKYSLPRGDLRSKFRIVARAPSASSNREMMKQHLFMLFNLTSQHIGGLIQIGETVIGQTNPMGWQSFKERMVNWMHNDLYKAIIEQHEIGGMGGRVPEMEPPTEMTMLANQQAQRAQAAEQQLQQLMMEYQALMDQVASNERSQTAAGLSE